MRTIKNSATLVITCLLLFTSLPSNAQFVTLIRKVKSGLSGNSAVSTVVLDAAATKVYEAVSDTLSKVPDARITKNNEAKRSVDFTKAKFDFTLKVDSLDVKLSQITVIAKEQGQPSSEAESSAVKVILAVCAKLGIKCTVENK